MTAGVVARQVAVELRLYGGGAVVRGAAEVEETGGVDRRGNRQRER
jgi:hypothetical protein